MTHVEVWVDGSCTNNGTPNARAGIGVYYGAKSERNYYSRVQHARQTNNTAELIAILYVLVTNPFTPLTVNTDSRYSIDCITVYASKWQSNNWKTAKGTDVESANIIRYILKVLEERAVGGVRTEFMHVKGHSGDAGNDAADKLARLGAAAELEGGKMRLLRQCGLPI